MNGGESSNAVFSWSKGNKQRLLLLPQADVLGLATTLKDQGATAVVSTAHYPAEMLSTLQQRLLRPATARKPLHPLLSAQCPVSEMEVASYGEKNLAVAVVADWAAQQGLVRRHVLALEQAIDELLLNALFDAPRDADKRPRFALLSPAERVLLQAHPHETVRLRFATDGLRIVVSVTDSIGQLRRDTVLDYLIRCGAAQARHQSPLENKTSGAGVGLFLVAEAASELFFRLRPGRLTEIVFCQHLARPRPLRVLLIDDR